MNRHIFGLSLFLVIVKIHFLLYWAFFAPVNFTSTQEKLVSTVPRFESAYKQSCNLAKKSHIELRSVAINFRKGYVAASADLSKFRGDADLSATRLRLHIFNEYRRSVWVGEFSPEQFETGKNVRLKKYSSALSDLDQKTNYYAQIEAVPAADFHTEKLMYEIYRATPVLAVDSER